MSDIEELTQDIARFTEERDWKQFHTPKDLAISLALEAGEVMEHFQWKTEREVEIYLQENKHKVARELADVFYYALLMSHSLGIDLGASLKEKMVENRAKYPVEKAKGSHKKYTEL